MSTWTGTVRLRRRSRVPVYTPSRTSRTPANKFCRSWNAVLCTRFRTRVENESDELNMEKQEISTNFSKLQSFLGAFPKHQQNGAERQLFVAWYFCKKFQDEHRAHAEKSINTSPNFGGRFLLSGLFDHHTGLVHDWKHLSIFLAPCF